MVELGTCTEVPNVEEVKQVIKGGRVLRKGVFHKVCHAWIVKVKNVKKEVHWWFNLK